MNIAFLSELFYPYGGGAELATYSYAKLLNESGLSVVVVTNRFPNEPEFSKSEGFTICRLPLLKRGESLKYSMLKRFDVLFSSFMRRLMKWAEIIYIPRRWYSAIPLAKVYGKPVIVHLHDYLPICPLTVSYDLSKNAICDHYNNFTCSPRCIMAYERSNARSSMEALTSVVLNLTVGRYIGKLVTLSDAVICVSKAQKRLIDIAAPFLNNKSCVIYNPLPEYSGNDIHGEDFGYFGGANLFKGFHILLRALRSIHRENLKVHATKLNNFPNDFAESLNLLGIVAYKRLDNERYRKVCRQVGAVIVPSVWPEPLPYVVSEALASKRLVIASRVGGIPEQVVGCKGAFLFEPGNHKELAEKIEFVSSLDSEATTDLGNHNMEFLTRKFDNQKTLRDFMSLCNKLR